eukprot:3074909-Rhodomonas_salina.2
MAHAGWEWREKADCTKSKDDPCLELVPARTEREVGHAVAHGEAELEEEMEKELAEHTPSEGTLKKYLGDTLYSEYEEEEKTGNFFGDAHAKVQRGHDLAVKRHAFRQAFGSDSFEWCLHEHRKDADFPKACTGDGRYAKGTYQRRNAQQTAPGEVLEGVLGAFGSVSLFARLIALLFSLSSVPSLLLSALLSLLSLSPLSPLSPLLFFPLRSLPGSACSASSFA